NLQPQDPVTLGLCSQIDLDNEVAKAARRLERERKESGRPLERAGTLLPASQTIPGLEPQPDVEIVVPRPEEKPVETEAEEDARVFARLREMGGGKTEEEGARSRSLPAQALRHLPRRRLQVTPEPGPPRRLQLLGEADADDHVADAAPVHDRGADDGDAADVVAGIHRIARPPRLLHLAPPGAQRRRPLPADPVERLLDVGPIVVAERGDAAPGDANEGGKTAADADVDVEWLCGMRDRHHRAVCKADDAHRVGRHGVALGDAVERRLNEPAEARAAEHAACDR